MKITNEFTVNTPIDRAWALLTDLEGIAPCMPGAQLTGVDGEVYKGKVKVKVGPVISEFAGTAQFTEKDDAAYRGVIDAKGRDARSAGNAAALVVAQLTADGEKTLVNVDTDLKISGKLAQFGAGMIKEVSGKLLAQFVANLETKLAAQELGEAAAEEEPALAAAASPAPSTAEPVVSAAAVATAPESTAVEPSPLDSPVAPPVNHSPVEREAIIQEVARSGSIAKVATESPARPRAAFVPSEEEPEALDLLSIAGGSIYKRVAPLVVGAVVIGGVIAWLVARRR